MDTAAEFVVITTRYGTNEVLHVYGPLTREAANRLAMALPSSSHRDHTVVAFTPTPTFDFADVKGRRGIEK